ncbi:MAG: sulfite exporter TauE/SafE family protein [Flavobacteriales bacterium]|nr:sulfite exporter TauE/SafE family protein [Flavobacteriales bacterium]
MDILTICGYAGAVAIGVIIGMLGGGGAILAVPILVYLFRVPADDATAYSLFVVGITALLASFRYLPRGHVNYRAAFLFLVPSVIFVYLTRTYVVPSIPNQIQFGSFVAAKKSVLMVAFALLMMVAGISMLRRLRRAPAATHVNEGVKNVSVMLWGTVVGFLAGLLGAGGGFMIVPVLVVFMKLPMKMAVGTSLTVIAGQSLSGFAGDVISNHSMDWGFLSLFTGLSLTGMLAGTWLANRISPESTRRVFGYFTIAMGATILMVELFI